jgi:hypothetical protein
MRHPARALLCQDDLPKFRDEQAREAGIHANDAHPAKLSSRPHVPTLVSRSGVRSVQISSTNKRFHSLGGPSPKHLNAALKPSQA